jgi:chemotaxis protein methyltransferase CheR
VLSMLKPGGWLFISHTETLHDISDAVEAVRPATYRKR